MNPTDRSKLDEDQPDPDAFVAQHPPERLKLIERWRWVCVFSLVSLIVLGLGWELWWAPLPQGTGMLALKVLPLCFGITGLLKHRLYTYRWLTLLIWLYFTEGVVRVTGDASLSQALAGIEVLLSIVLFTACSIYVRLRLRVLPPKAKKSK